MEKSVKVSAKYIQKTCILGKIQWPKIPFGAKCNGEKRRGFGKIHTKKMHSGQNTIEKELHFGQNTMEKSVKV